MQQRDDKTMACAEGSVGLEFFSPTVQVGFVSLVAAVCVTSLAAMIDPIRGGVVVDLVLRGVWTSFETALAPVVEALIGILG